MIRIALSAALLAAERADQSGASPSADSPQRAQSRNQLTCLALSFTPSFGRDHTELLR